MRPTAAPNSEASPGTPSPVQAVRPGRAPKSVARRVGLWALISVLTAWTLAPVVSLLFASLTPESAPLSSGLGLPEAFTGEHYDHVLNDTNVLRAMGNSLFVSAITTVGCWILGAPAAYGFARHTGRGARWTFIALLFIRCLPFMTFAVPVYTLSNQLGLLGTRIDLLLIQILWNLPLAIWLMRSFMVFLPKELENAAAVDGASHLQTFVRIVLPLVRPGIAVSGVFVFLYSFIEFLYGSLLTSGETVTLPVAMAQFGTSTSIFWRPMAAATLMSVIPLLLLFGLAHRYIVRGLTLGGVK